MGNTLPHPSTASAGLTVFPATQCDTGLWPTSQRGIMERSDTERLCQDLLQSAGQDGHITTSLAFLMPGKSLLWKREICRKISWSGIHPAGQGLTLSSRERQVILCNELGTVKAHRNVELCTLTRAHLTIMGCPASDRVL